MPTSPSDGVIVSDIPPPAAQPPRGEIIATVRPLQPGQSMLLLPPHQYDQRTWQQRVAGAAHFAFGKGCYRTRREGHGLRLWRIR